MDVSQDPFQPVKDNFMTSSIPSFSDDDDDHLLRGVAQISASQQLGDTSSLLNSSMESQARLLSSSMEVCDQQVPFHQPNALLSPILPYSAHSSPVLPQPQTHYPHIFQSQPHPGPARFLNPLPAQPAQPAQPPTQLQQLPPPTNDESEPALPVNRVVNVYDIKGKALEFKKRELTQKQQQELSKRDPTLSRGDRCEGFVEDPNSRANSRRNNLAGFKKKMRDLKTTTNDDLLIHHYKFYGTPKCVENKWATDLRLLNLTPTEQPQPSDPPPPAAVLQAASPSRTRHNTKRWVCPHCGIPYGTKADINWNGANYDEEWIGCSHPVGSEPTCKTWEHKKCNGIVMTKNVKSVQWLCEEHREKPPKGSCKRKLAKTK